MKKLLTLLISTHLIAANAQWTAIPSGTSYDLEDVHFPTDSIGYAVGYQGIVLKSTDTGETWSTVHQDSSKFFNSVFFTSSGTGYAAGGSLYKTTDGGFHWEPIIADSFHQMT